eukprot:1141136-Pelagomonas_calceolata.AAC.7
MQQPLKACSTTSYLHSCAAPSMRRGTTGVGPTGATHGMCTCCWHSWTWRPTSSSPRWEESAALAQCEQSGATRYHPEDAKTKCIIMMLICSGTRGGSGMRRPHDANACRNLCKCRCL